MQLNFKRLRPDVSIPKYAMPGDAGLDVYMPESLDPIVWGLVTMAGLYEGWDTHVASLRMGVASSEMGKTLRIPLGFAVEIPAGHVGWLTNKSSRYFQGLDVHGIIDSGYRGEVCAQVRAIEPVIIEPGTKLCQLLIMPVAKCLVIEVDELTETTRGDGGFGSTGER